MRVEFRGNMLLFYLLWVCSVAQFEHHLIPWKNCFLVWMSCRVTASLWLFVTYSTSCSRSRVLAWGRATWQGGCAKWTRNSCWALAGLVVSFWKLLHDDVESRSVRQLTALERFYGPTNREAESDREKFPSLHNKAEPTLINHGHTLVTCKSRLPHAVRVGRLEDATRCSPSPFRVQNEALKIPMRLFTWRTQPDS